MLRRLFAARGGLAAPVAGAALPLSFAPFGLYWLAPILLAILFLSWEDRTARERLRRGFWFGFAAFATGTYWLYNSIHDFGGTAPPFAIAVVLALVVTMAGYHAVCGWLSAWAAPRSQAWQLMAVLPAAWTLMEWLRGWLFGGFPWLSLGYGQIDGPLRVWAAVIGVHGMTLLVAVGAGCLATLLASRGRPRAMAAGVLVLFAAATWPLAGRMWTTPAGPELRVSLLQGGVSQDQKWLPEARDSTLDMYRELTVGLTNQDLIIWPEAAVPALAHEVEGYLRGLGELAKARHQQVLVGILTYDFDTGAFHNSLLAIGAEPGVYHKRHLVPFGEFFPVPPFVRNVLRLMSLPYQDMTPGLRSQPALRAHGIALAPSICYEDVFGTELRDFLPAAGLLVNVSNDGWFGDSIAPHQHLQMARLRALESGRYMLRSTNTGITAVIAPDGHIVTRAEQFRTAVVSAVVRPYTGATPFVRFGNLPALIAALLLIAGALVGGVSFPANSRGSDSP